MGPNYREAVLELNASNERGIDVVRNKIKAFAQTKVTLSSGKHKIIILDEADAMTEGAQQALRRTMEVFAKTTRFALACNTSEKIIEPIQSRCAVIRFTKLNDQQIGDKLRQICAKESLKYDKEGIEALVFTAQGDMRQAINNLQSTADGFGHITSDNVFKVCDEPHPLFIKDILKNCLEQNIDEGMKIMHNLYKMGYSPEDIIANMFRVTKTYSLPEYLKLEFIREIGITHMRIAQGVNSLLQLSALVARLCKLTIKSDNQ